MNVSQNQTVFVTGRQQGHRPRHRQALRRGRRQGRDRRDRTGHDGGGRSAWRRNRRRGARPVICDVTDAKAVQEAYGEAEAKLGPLSVSVQNAGVITIAKVEDLTEREWDLNLDVNTKGVFLCCQEAIRRFRASGTRGRLINTASGQARAGLHLHARTTQPRNSAWSA